VYAHSQPLGQVLTPVNHGFHSRHSYKSQLLLTTHELLKHRDQGSTVDVGILGFSKAFDTVPHRHLINKLRIYGIHGVVSSWIEAFLSCCQQAVSLPVRLTGMPVSLHTPLPKYP